MEFDQVFSWHYIKEHFPVFASNVEKEFDANAGSLPYEKGFVYVIHAVGSDYYKIGKSINPDRRLLQIATQMPFPTRFIRVWKSNFMSLAEKRLHEDFALFRANGEWFKFSVDFLMQTIWTQQCAAKYAYAYVIRDLLQLEPREMVAFLSGPEYLDPAVCGSKAIAIIENWFDYIDDDRNSSPPSDVLSSYYQWLEATREARQGGVA